MIKANLKENDKGFSLIELCMALTVMAIMAAFTIPQLTSAMRSMQVASDARSIATAMTYAKMSAASQTTRCRLSFDTGTNEWKLEKRNPSTGSYELQQAVNQLSKGISSSGVAFKPTSSTAPSGFVTNSSTVITFSSRGTLIEPSTGMGIVYISNNSEDYAVSVSLSGKVQVWRYRNSQWVEQ